MWLAGRDDDSKGHVGRVRPCAMGTAGDHEGTDGEVGADLHARA